MRVIYYFGDLGLEGLRVEGFRGFSARLGCAKTAEVSTVLSVSGPLT